MRYMRMPNGENVQIPDDATPQDIAAMRAQYAKKPAAISSQADSMRTAPTRRQARIERRKQEIKRTDSGSGMLANVLSGVMNPVGTAQEIGQQLASKITGGRVNTPSANPVRNLVRADQATGGIIGSGYAFGMDDEAKGAMYSAARALKGEGEGLRQDYRTERDARRELKRDFQNESPGTALAAEIGGAVLNPLGTGARALFTAGKAVAPVSRTAGKALMRTAARSRASGPVAKAIQAGAVQGAAQGAGAANELSDIPESALTGAAVGAGFGGALGGGVVGARSAVQTIRDRGVANAPRKAFERVGSLISKAKDADGRKLTGAKVRQQVADAQSEGANMSVMDTVPSLRAESAYLARSSNVPRSNDLQEFGEQRIRSRNARFKDEVSKRASTVGEDARDYVESLDQARKGIGSFDYREGGPIDNPVPWQANGPLDTFFKQDRPTVQKALKEAYNIMLDEGRDPTQLNLGQGVFTGVPTFRTMDYLKRGLNDLTEKAMGKNGEMTAKARRISEMANELKAMMIDANPEYGKILAAQRDPFQKKQAAMWGEWAFKKLTSEPRQILRKIENEPDEVKDSIRIGIIDNLLNLDTKADPVSAVLGYMRNEPQRKVMEFAFGGKKEAESFAKWVEREFKAVKSDAVTSTARNSITSHVQLVRDGAFGAAEEAGFQGLKGMAFGGGAGFAANFTRALQNLKNGMTVDVQDEIARILMSNGDDLEEGIAAAAKFMAQRNRVNTKYGVNVAKAGAAPIASEIGSD